MAVSRTGIVYDEEMVKHYCLWDPNYPECPERFSKVLERCKELGLVDRCRRIPSREASSDEILVKHSPEMITLLEECKNKNEEELEEISSHYDSIYICSDTYRLAKTAIGSVINLVKEICENNLQNGMAIVRPPGHHAMKSAYCGYCFFNNVALAADYVLKNYNLSRILIVDWDVHHGQATQQMFYDDKRVLYFSIHRFEYGTFWPNLRESDYDYIGEGNGEGYNFNVPLNKTGFGNTEYLAIFNELLLPVATEYNPDLIIVSAGYDAAIGCPEFEPQLILVSGGYDAAIGDDKGQMKVEPAFYAHLVNSLAQLASGKIAVVLEGGYFLKSLAEGAALTLRALLGDPCPYIDPTGSPDENIRETIRNVIYSHRETWDCFKIYDTFSPTQLLLPADSHLPVIKFDYDEKPLEVFPTREAYAVVLSDMISYFNDWLNDLIEGTDLRNPKHKCMFFSQELENDKILDYIFQDSRCMSKGDCPDFENFFQKIKSKNVEWENTIETEQSSHINHQIENYDSFFLRSLLKSGYYLHKKLIGSAIIEEAENYTGVSKNMVEFFKKYNAKKILVINLHSEKFKTSKGSENRLMLTISNGNLSENVAEQDTEYNIDIKWNDTPVGNFEYVTLWFKIVLPICYQFGPEIILVFIDFDNLQKNQTTAELTGHLIHWLSVLAEGKITLFVNKIESEFSKSALMYASKALVGEVLPNLNVKNTNKNGIDLIKKMIENLEPKWSSLIKFVKFPSKYA